MYQIVHGNAPQYLKQDIYMVNAQHYFYQKQYSIDCFTPGKIIGEKDIYMLSW